MSQTRPSMLEEAAQRILILFAHPALDKSRVNRRLIDAVRALEGITFRDLYEEYPDFHIRVREEQSLLESHDIVVIQHPFFWYSTPAIVKEWEDLVLQHGWAYGSAGTALQGKKFLSVLTTGGSEAAYQKDGHNRFTTRELLAPIEQTAFLCGMDFLPPFVVHGSLGMEVEAMEDHAQDYRRALIGLRDGTLDLERARQFPRLNSSLDDLLPPSGEGEAHAR